MKRVTGIGGIFFQAKDPPALHAWYKRHLGIDVQEWGGTAFTWTDDGGEPAEDAIRGFPGVQRKVMHDHEEMGEKAYLISIVVGVLALAGAI